MENIFSGVLFFQGLFWLFLIVALVYFFAKRITDKENETFEDRDF